MVDITVCQKRDLKRVSRSEMIVVGSPWLQKTASKNMRAVSWAEAVM